MKAVKIVILFMLLTETFAVQGQIIESMGLKAGISMANQSYRFTPIDYAIETEPVIGPAAGLFVETFRKEHLSIQMDLAFAAKGSKSSTQSITVNHLDNDRITVNEGDLRVSDFYYLSLSPMARYRFENERMSPYFLLGPRLDFLLKYKTDSDYPLEEQNSVIVGLSGGMGLEFKLRELGVFVEVQFQPDLSTVTSKDPLRVNNNILFISLGVRLFK